MSWITAITAMGWFALGALSMLGFFAIITIVIILMYGKYQPLPKDDPENFYGRDGK